MPTMLSRDSEADWSLPRTSLGSCSTRRTRTRDRMEAHGAPCSELPADQRRRPDSDSVPLAAAAVHQHEESQSLVSEAVTAVFGAVVGRTSPSIGAALSASWTGIRSRRSVLFTRGRASMRERRKRGSGPVQSRDPRRPGRAGHSVLRPCSSTPDRPTGHQGSTTCPSGRRPADRR